MIAWEATVACAVASRLKPLPPGPGRTLGDFRKTSYREGALIVVPAGIGSMRSYGGGPEPHGECKTKIFRQD